MGRILLVLRLVVADVRRHPVQAAILLLSITVASATLALGGTMLGATDALYRQTRAATAGPDMVALAPGGDPATTAHLKTLEHAPGVVGHNGPYLRYYTEFTAHGSTAKVVAQGAPATPGPINRPSVTSGSWIRPGGVVVERGFANALGVHVGDQVTVAGRSRPVVGTAVTAADHIYPWAEMIGPGGGPSDLAGLVWLSEPDAGALAATDLEVTSVLDLKLRDPDATQAFTDSVRDPLHASAIRVHTFTWQFIAAQDDVILQGTQPILVVGSWLLSFLAIAGMAALAAGRAAKHTRRVGLLKAVGATPGLIAAALLAEYVILALVADALGLTAAHLLAPTVINPTGSLISTGTGLTGTTVAITTAVALAVAMVTTLGPTVHALRTETVAALADTARRPVQRARLTSVSALLPVPLLLGLRLVARRPGRAFLQACSVTATGIMTTGLLMIFAQPVKAYGLGSTELINLKAGQERHLIVAVTAALITLAAVNTLTITWTTALEARPTMAVARTLGATPGQVTAGLSTAQLLPTVPGALVGIPMGILFCLPFTGAGTVYPPVSSLFAAALAAVLATALLTALPARVAAHRSVAQTLSAEAT
ncbi:hypothetical protein QR77_20065 [Streptomyces sp. 150FB]|uniref:ABC transporter permease n=1 Tax=Streptomyces sp. 150FB TaxID=1576605 RepID=UPI0005893515|nr:ABC transporter permease [Streptomyces sp. 150FB]KIF75579.1 hypothetical protein QR77_20065 [Streptomyces sp. 150FB]